MPKAKLHKAKSIGVPVGMDKATFPSIYIPASEEIIKALELDQMVEVTLKGKITSLNLNIDRAGFNMEVHEVEAYLESGYEKMSKDDEKDEED